MRYPVLPPIAWTPQRTCRLARHVLARFLEASWANDIVNDLHWMTTWKSVRPEDYGIMVAMVEHGTRDLEHLSTMEDGYELTENLANTLEGVIASSLSSKHNSDPIKQWYSKIHNIIRSNDVSVLTADEKKKTQVPFSRCLGIHSYHKH